MSTGSPEADAQLARIINAAPEFTDERFAIVHSAWQNATAGMDDDPTEAGGDALNHPSVRSAA